MALLLEVYRDMGVKFEEAWDELQKHIADPTRPQKPREPDNAASMAMLSAMMAGSDFKGVR